VYYAIESMRVDGDRSADPNDYPSVSADTVVGSVLHGFLRCYMPTELLPTDLAREQGPRVSWALPTAFELQRDPTKADLVRWSRVQGLTMACDGRMEVWVPDEEPPAPAQAPQRAGPRKGTVTGLHQSRAQRGSIPLSWQRWQRDGTVEQAAAALRRTWDQALGWGGDEVRIRAKGDGTGGGPFIRMRADHPDGRVMRAEYHPTRGQLHWRVD
jgi:hypothetical protein